WLPRGVDVLDELTHLVVHLYPRSLSIADIDEAISVHGQAVHVLHPLGLPLAQEFSSPIDHRDAAVNTATFAVGDVNVAVLWVDPNARGREKLRGVRIQRLTLLRAIRRIQDAFLTDLEQELASVVGVFLNHAGRRTRYPEIVVFVDETTVQAGVEHAQIAPGISHVARGIQLDDRRSQMPRIQVSLQHVLPIQEKYMVLGIHAYSAE